MYVVCYILHSICLYYFEHTFLSNSVAISKIMAVLVAAIMVVAMTVPAFAAPTADGVIKIGNAIVGEEYSLYKIFDLTYGGEGSTSVAAVPSTDSQEASSTGYSPVAYTYTKASTDPFFTALGGTDSPFALTATLTTNVYNVKRKDGKTDAEVVNWIKSNLSSLPSDRKHATTITGSATAENNKWTALPYGYYYITSTAGSLVTIDSTMNNVTVNEKNVIPTDDKKVVDSDPELSQETLVAEDDAQIGDWVNFRIKVTDGKGTDKHIVVHDTMSSGLTLDIESFAVNKGGNPVDAADYKIYVEKSLTVIGTNSAIDKTKAFATDAIMDGATTVLTAGETLSFAIVFDDAFVANRFSQGDVVTVSYRAKLNNAAKVSTPETNVSGITYSNQPLTSHTASVKTYDVDIIKYDSSDDQNKTPIGGATFELQNADGSTGIWLVPGSETTDGYDVYEVSDNQSPTLTGLTAVYDPKDPEVIYAYKEGANFKYFKYFITTANKKVRIDGLDRDVNYKLEEVISPNGYYKMEAKDSVTASAKTGAGDFPDRNIANTKGTELPQTGGMGTTVLYIVGGMLIVLAGAYLFFSRKRTA